MSANATGLRSDTPRTDEGHRTTAESDSAEGLASRWIETWNWRETDSLIALADPQIVVLPLRLRGLRQRYEGHDGIRAWMTALRVEGHSHRISAASVSQIDEARALAVGTVTIGGDITSPFTGIYELAGGRMLTMSHYFAPARVLASIGTLDPDAVDG